MTTTSALITATLAVVVYSLWVRRHTWRSHWEVGASLGILLEGCALVLMSPWAATTLGPPLYRLTGLWNMQTMLGHVCAISALAAIISHVLVRLADGSQMRLLFRSRITTPVRLGLVLLVVTFIIADEEYHADMFSAAVNDFWLAAYWLVVGSLVIYLSGYGGRVLLILRADPRGTATAHTYLVSAMFGVLASALQMTTAWTTVDVTPAVWLCACLGVGIFAGGAARSWQAKVAWFAPGDNRPVPPQPA